MNNYRKMPVRGHATQRRTLPGVIRGLALGALVAGGLTGVDRASAMQMHTVQTTTWTFTTAGTCSTWSPPSGVSTIYITAVGAAGESSGAAGGRGDGVRGILSSLTSGQTLDVCVDVGGGAGGSGPFSNGGAGGGASGVSLASDFSVPEIVAGGGGGASRNIYNYGGDAGMPVAGAGGESGIGGGGGDNTLGKGGAGGSGFSGGPNGLAGSGSTASGPGTGGAGVAASYLGSGGGGAGYYGGGSGGGNSFVGLGGGGGTDFCGTSLSNCTLDAHLGTATGAGTDPGDAQVILSTVPPTPTISTSVIGGGTIGSSMSDTATLAHSIQPYTDAQANGTVTFAVYGPFTATDTPTCTAQYLVHTSPAESVSSSTASPANTATSDGFTPSQAGTYYWVASYSGNGYNTGVSGTCGDPGESSAVTPASPSLSSSATRTVSIGSGITDTATLRGGYAPYGDANGTVTFRLYGPFSASTTPTCTAPYLVHTSPAELVSDSTASPANTATSDSYTPSQIGTYYWVASYNGNGNNTAVSGTCGDPSETSTVSIVTPTLTATAGPDVTLGSGAALTASAILSGGYSPSGTITFSLTDPSNTPVYTDVVPVSGNGTYSTSQGTNPGGYLPVVSGQYHWSVTYSGDGNNQGASDTSGSENVIPTVTIFVSAPTPYTASTGTQIANNGTPVGMATIGHPLVLPTFDPVHDTFVPLSLTANPVIPASAGSSTLFLVGFSPNVNGTWHTNGSTTVRYTSIESILQTQRTGFVGSAPVQAQTYTQLTSLWNSAETRIKQPYGSAASMQSAIRSFICAVNADAAAKKITTGLQTALITNADMAWSWFGGSGVAPTC